MFGFGGDPHDGIEEKGETTGGQRQQHEPTKDELSHQGSADVVAAHEARVCPAFVQPATEVTGNSS